MKGACLLVVDLNNMASVWQYLLRLAIAIYFILNHVKEFAANLGLIHAANSVKVSGVFSCVNAYIPATVASSLWHAFFILLGLLILLWPNPTLWLIIGLLVLMSELYINYSAAVFGASSILIIILILVSLALIIYYGRSGRYR